MLRIITFLLSRGPRSWLDKVLYVIAKNFDLPKLFFSDITLLHDSEKVDFWREVVCLSVCPSVGLAVCPSVRLSVCIQFYLGHQWSDLAEILVGDKVRKYPQAVFSFFGKVDFKGLPTPKNMPKMAKIV